MLLFVLIPLLPLLAFLTLVAGGSRWGHHSHRIGITAIGLSCALSIAALFEVYAHGPMSIPLYQFFQSGSLAIDVGLYVDQLTVLLLLLVTGVSSIVHVFSSRYMIGDPRYNRFFAVIALFTFSMLMVVMSSNLLILYMFWEVMGLCSYLLIAHSVQRKPAIQAATKAFLVNAIADVGLGFGIILIFATFGTLDIQTILAQAERMQDQTVNLLGWIGLDLQIHPVTVIPFFLFIGVMGKSAQLPFHVWLPVAMEAPTPVSALIHAATMVNAGPFLLVRLSPLLVLSPMAMTWIAVIGAVTALFAAMVAITQSDIKKSLAYSTMSQIGFMIMACGLGAFVAAIFHLLAHGFLKAFLFLSTGNTLQSVANHQHTESGHKTPRQTTVLSVGALMLACLPPLVIFSGPYEAMWIAHDFPLARIVFWIMGLITVFCTAIYLFRRLVALSQSGPVIRNPQTGDAFTHIPRLFSPSHLVVLLTSGGVMLAMLMALWTWFVQFLTPALAVSSSFVPERDPMLEITWWVVLPVGVAISGWAYAVSRHTCFSTDGARNSAFMNILYVFSLNKGYFDEIYEAAIVQPTLRFAHWLWHKIDVQGIDRIVHGIASLSICFARWLWQVVNLKGVDRVTLNIGRQGTNFGEWLCQLIDRLDQKKQQDKGKSVRQGTTCMKPDHILFN